jgi:Ca2+-transporting ATPase
LEKRDWHSLTVEETLKALASDAGGLSSQEAQRRLEQYGRNELRKEKKASPPVILLRQFKNVLVIILLIAAAISGALALTGHGESHWDPVIIVGVVIASVILGFVQEYRAERAMDALKQMMAPMCSAIRDGKEESVHSRNVVPGDIMLLRTGDRVAADGRLLEVSSLNMDESALTGESVSVQKGTRPLEGPVELGDKDNMVFAGTTVAYGKGKAVVVNTGMSTEFGRIAGMLEEMEEPRTPLQESLDRFGKMMAIALLAVSALVVILVIVRLKISFLEVFIWAVSLAVVVVPESLPAIVTVSLAFGVYRMARKHALIRKLHAVETLGCTTYICSDKTGTLTQNQMTVRKIYVSGQLLEVTGVGYEPRGEFRKDGSVIALSDDPSLKRLLEIGALCNDAGLESSDGVWKIRGDPTEGALVAASVKGGIDLDSLSRSEPRVDEIPFSSERKRMTTLHEGPLGRVAFSKGAAEVVLNSSSRSYDNGTERDLLPQDREEILETNRRMAEEGLRVLGFAYKSLEGGNSNETAEQDMVFTGLVGMIDPPREEAKEAIRTCQKAGMRAVMITGDHKTTAVAIAGDLGMLQGGLAVSGVELDSMSDDEFTDKVEKIDVYARVSPEHKLRVVDALQKKGHVVAMTGDGVNDAPALKKADIGVAMGVTGTDVSREAAHMVLTDDNFASIVAAIKEGRSIFANIKKCIMYLLSCHVGELTLMVIAVLVGTPLPLIAVQLLWINIASDGPPAMALAFDPPDPGIMEQPPRDRKKSIFTYPVTRFIALRALWTGLVTFGVFYWALHSGRSELESQALCFITLLVIEKFTALNSRSETEFIFKLGIFRNKWLILAIIGTMAASLPIIYLPSLQTYFHTYSLSLWDWGITLLAGLTLFVVVEVAKAIWKRNERRSAVAVPQ